LGILTGKFCEKFDLEFSKIELMRRGQRIGDRSKIRVCWVNVYGVRGEELVGRRTVGHCPVRFSFLFCTGCEIPHLPSAPTILIFFLIE